MYKINCKCPEPCAEKYIEDELLDKTCENVLSEYDNSYNECACGFNEEYNAFPNNHMLGYCYVPKQVLDKVFTPCVGLKMGTMFSELVSPYTPCQAIEENEYLKMKKMEGCVNECC